MTLESSKVQMQEQVTTQQTQSSPKTKDAPTPPPSQIVTPAIAPLRLSTADRILRIVLLVITFGAGFGFFLFFERAHQWFFAAVTGQRTTEPKNPQTTEPPALHEAQNSQDAAQLAQRQKELMQNLKAELKEIERCKSSSSRDSALDFLLEENDTTLPSEALLVVTDKGKNIVTLVLESKDPALLRTLLDLLRIMPLDTTKSALYPPRELTRTFGEEIAYNGSDLAQQHFFTFLNEYEIPELFCSKEIEQILCNIDDNTNEQDGPSAKTKEQVLLLLLKLSNESALRVLYDNKCRVLTFLVERKEIQSVGSQIPELWTALLKRLSVEQSMNLLEMPTVFAVRARGVGNWITSHHLNEMDICTLVMIDGKDATRLEFLEIIFNQKSAVASDSQGKEQSLPPVFLFNSGLLCGLWKGNEQVRQKIVTEQDDDLFRNAIAGENTSTLTIQEVGEELRCTPEEVKSLNDFMRAEWKKRFSGEEYPEIQLSTEEEESSDESDF